MSIEPFHLNIEAKKKPEQMCESMTGNMRKSATFKKPIVVAPSKKVRRSLGLPPKAFKKSPQPKVNVTLLSKIPKSSLLALSSSETSVGASLSSGISSGASSGNVSPRDSQQEQKQQQQQQQRQPLAAVKPKANAGVVNNKVAPLPRCLTLQRQRTEAILKFRSRKSVSQMDFKEARRTGTFQQCYAEQPLALVPVQQQQNQQQGVLSNVVMTEAREMLSQLYTGNMSAYVAQAPDLHTAGLRIFNTVMLRAWRRRREEVRQMSEEIDELKRGSIKNKNQLHVFNSLFRVEQRRNELLNVQHRKVHQDVTAARTTAEELQQQVNQLKLNEEVLRQQLVEKYQEAENLSVLLGSAKTELFQAMTKERELLAGLTSTQRELQTVQMEHADTKLELEQLTLLNEETITDLKTTIAEREEELEEVKQQLANYALTDELLKSKSSELLQCQDNEERLQQQLDMLQSHVNTLEQCLAATLGNRLKQCFNQSVTYQRHATYQMLHWVAYFMLPAAPTPRVTSLPVGVALKKVKALFSTNFRSN